MNTSHERIKVVRLIPVLDFGGVESRFILQSKLIDRERFDFRVCTFWKPGAAAEKIRESGIEVDVLGVNPAVRNLDATLKLFLYLNEHKPDVLHASIVEAMFHGAIASFLARVPLRIIEDTGVPTRSAVGNMAYGAISRLVHHVIGVSQATCDYLLEQDRMAKDRVRLLYNCGKPEFFQGDRTRKRDPDAPLALFTAGRLVPVKNQLMLIEMMRQLVHERGVNVTLDIAGDGALMEDLQQAIVDAELEEHVTMLGFRKDVRELLDEHDLFILPSHNEGCSIALIEAMATGSPVLGSTAPGIAEVMGKLGAHYLVPPKEVKTWVDRVEEIAAWSGEELDAYGARGQKIARAEFSPQRYIGDLERLYASVRARKKP